MQRGKIMPLSQCGQRKKQDVFSLLTPKSAGIQRKKIYMLRLVKEQNLEEIRWFSTGILHNFTAFSTWDSEREIFTPVNIYYNTSCGFLQENLRIFFRFYFNRNVLCNLSYVNLCIFRHLGYVVSTKSGVHKNTHGKPCVFFARKLIKISVVAFGLRPRHHLCSRWKKSLLTVLLRRCR